MGTMKTTEDGRYECDFRSLNTHQNIHCESYILYKHITGDSEENDGSVNFYRPWNQYKRGFGNVESEYWLGKSSQFVCVFVWMFMSSV